MTTDPYNILFEPVRIGPVTAPNRFFAVPHATGHGWNQPNGANALRAMKAEGGWGTVAVQITEIGEDSDFANHPMERLWDETDIPRHAAQVEAIKAHGSLAAIELAHGGARTRNFVTARPVMGPSALPILRPEIPLQAKAMDKADINSFRAAHIGAVERAKSAGYDIVYVYAAHDLSILSHFLSSNTNFRTDEYGGSFNNRVRLLREVLEDTLEVANGEVAVALRFAVAEPGKNNGLRHDGEGRDVVEALAELPDLWDVNIAGWPNDSATARFTEEGFQLPYTDFVKELTSKPVVGVGRFTSPDMMVSLVRKKRLDLIGAARPSIADPFLPAKIREGRVEEIRECIGCNVCVSMDGYGVPIRCTQNPTISEEWRRGWHPEAPAISKKRQSHLIVGAGPAGLECAVTLLKAGQKVTLVDQADEPGGRVASEARLPGLNSWGRVRDHRTYLLSQKNDAELYLSSPMTAENITDFGADTVTLATGANWRLDGVGSSNFTSIEFGDLGVFSPDDIMSDRFRVDPEKSFVVYDDDHFYMASVLAEKLAAHGCRVTYVTPLAEISTWTGYTLDQGKIIERFCELGIVMVPNTKLGKHGVLSSVLTGGAVPLEFENLVFVGARTPNDGLATALSKLDLTSRLSITGDCLVPGTIQAAVFSGHFTARQILNSESGERAGKREQTSLQK